MNYVRYEHIQSDSRMIPDGEVFTVYRQIKNDWAFAMKINNQFTLTRFQDQNVDKGGVRKAREQILFCKHYGWSYTGQKTWNTDVDDMEAEFMCMYCKKTTYDTSKPCECRNKKVMDFAKKTDSGIILPF